MIDDLRIISVGPLMTDVERYKLAPSTIYDWRKRIQEQEIAQ